MLTALLVPLATLAALPASPPPDNAGAYTVDTLAGDAVVLRTALSGSGWGNDRDPLIEVRADGTVTVAVDGAVGGYERGRLSADGLDDLLDAAEEAALLDVPDYGDVEVTDVGSTVVAITVDGGSATHSVWALGVADDIASGSLTSEQSADRTGLSGFLATVDAILATPALFDEPIGPFDADRLYVTVSAVNWDGQGQPEDPVTVAEWPLETPIDALPFTSDFDGLAGCTTLLGEDAVTLQQAIGDTDTDDAVVVATGTDRPDVPAAVYVWVSTVVTPRSGCAAPDDAVGVPGPLPDTVYLALTGEVQMADVLAASPWPVDDPTATMTLERLVADPAFFAAVGTEIGRPIEWVKATWFDVVAYAGDIDGQRNVIVRATCSRYITDEFDQCELWGRFDVTTGEIVDIELRTGEH